LFLHHHAQAGMVLRQSGSPDKRQCRFRMTCLPHRQPRGFGHSDVRAAGEERL